MSNDPENPFSRKGSGELSGERFGSQRPKKSNVWLWVAGIVGGLGLIAAIACCGAVYFALQVAPGMLLQEELQANATIQENLGDVESVKINLSATGRENQDNPDDETMVFDIDGSEADGQVVVRQAGSEIRPVELILGDGTRLPLDEEVEFSFDEGDLEIPEIEIPDGENLDGGASREDAGTAAGDASDDGATDSETNENDS